MRQLCGVWTPAQCFVQVCTWSVYCFRPTLIKIGMRFQRPVRLSSIKFCNCALGSFRFVVLRMWAPRYGEAGRRNFTVVRCERARNCLPCRIIVSASMKADKNKTKLLQLRERRLVWQTLKVMNQLASSEMLECSLQFLAGPYNCLPKEFN